MFIEAWTVVNDVMDAEEVFTQQAEYEVWLDAQKKAALEDGAETQIYARVHDHPEGMDCECAQFETNHAPVWDSTEDGD